MQVEDEKDEFDIEDEEGITEMIRKKRAIRPPLPPFKNEPTMMLLKKISQQQLKDDQMTLNEHNEIYNTENNILWQKEHYVEIMEFKRLAEKNVQYKDPQLSSQNLKDN